MTWATLGLTAGFILVLSILYLLLLRTQLPVGIKLVTVIFVSLFFWVQYESLQQYSGWPSTDDLPEQFVLIASEVIEPNKQSGEKGIMYWWLRDSNDPKKPPRVFELPYDPQIQEKTEQVLKEQSKGSVYVARREETGTLSKGLGVKFEKISKAKKHQKK